MSASIHFRRVTAGRVTAGRVTRAFALVGALAVSGVASAADFAVTGTLNVNGTSGNLPSGGAFAGSAYDPATGLIAAGAFTFPSSTISFPSSFGTVVVTYVLSQTDTSTGAVAQDGVAALTNASLALTVTHVTVSGIPVSVGTCVLAPIVVPLAGTASAAGLDLSASGFTIPPVAASDCGGNGAQINNAVAGSNNTMHVLMAGDFSPPADDVIFSDGFEQPA